MHQSESFSKEPNNNTKILLVHVRYYKKCWPTDIPHSCKIQGYISHFSLWHAAVSPHPSHGLNRNIENGRNCDGAEVKIADGVSHSQTEAEVVRKNCNNVHGDGTFAW